MLCVEQKRSKSPLKVARGSAAAQCGKASPYRRLVISFERLRLEPEA
jgi:hypothetical protein